MGGFFEGVMVLAVSGMSQHGREGSGKWIGFNSPI